MRITRDPLKATAVRWVVLGLVSSIYFVTYIDRVNISIAAPTISTELGIGPAVQFFFSRLDRRPGQKL